MLVADTRANTVLSGLAGKAAEREFEFSLPC
jgi:hypothetical protein